MEMVSGLDLHRSQITFRTVDLRTGEVQRGKIHPGARDRFREWLGRVEPGTDAHFALEGTTGWRFVVEEGDRAPGLHRPPGRIPRIAGASRTRRSRALAGR